MAEKISDKILCVKGDHTVHYGTPEEIFEEQKIRNLYGIDNGYFDLVFGSIELSIAEGAVKTFVLCGAGTGIPESPEVGYSLCSRCSCGQLQQMCG